MTMTHNSPEQNERIRARAYTLWEEAGRPHGQSEEFWRKAARLLKAKSQADTDHHADGRGTTQS
jgi:hypothetical protein